MLYVSILTSDRERDPELWATIWQAQQPATLTLLHAYNLANDKRVFVWEGEGRADLQFMDRFNQIGLLETFPALDQTSGWIPAFAGDLDEFRRVQTEVRGNATPAVERAVDLRRRGLEAPSPWAARQAAREWVAEQEEGA